MRARPRPPVRGRGIFSGTGVIIIGLAATIAALVFPIWSYADRSDPTGAVNVLSAQTVSTRYGPLSGLDRDFIVKVRLAGLWELPAGEMAEQKGTTQAVRTAGQHLVDGHAALDAHVRTVATRLGVPLPNQPNAQQEQWLATLTAAQGQDFDREFANIVRLAHGRVFSVVAQVRAGTQNALVRDLADDANTTVLDHIKVLEATGYVDYSTLARQLATTPSPAASPPVVAPRDATPVLPSPTPSPTSPYTLPPATTSPPPISESP
jgi:predicted outer membrane protein